LLFVVSFLLYKVKMLNYVDVALYSKSTNFQFFW